MLTYKGRSADSGHYVAWVKQENCELHQSLSNCVILSEVCQLLVLIPLSIVGINSFENPSLTIDFK